MADIKKTKQKNHFSLNITCSFLSLIIELTAKFPFLILFIMLNKSDSCNNTAFIDCQTL